jgi:hypothetical protein
MVTDPVYLYCRLEFLMRRGVNFETFHGAFLRTADSSLVHSYAPVPKTLATEPSAAGTPPGRKLPTKLGRLFPSW